MIQIKCVPTLKNLLNGFYSKISSTQYKMMQLSNNLSSIILIILLTMFISTYPNPTKFLKEENKLFIPNTAKHYLTALGMKKPQ